MLRKPNLINITVIICLIIFWYHVLQLLFG